jgi:phage baseplate assembly protein gpV
MAIDTGIALNCANLVEVGGLQNIFVTDLDNLATVTPSGSGGYTSLVGTVDWAMFQLKPNTATWSSTSTKENGITKYETTIKWYIPNIGAAKLAILEGMRNKCIVAVAEFRSGKFRTCGISEEYQGFGNGDNYKYNKTYAQCTVEEDSGSDFVDGNGATVTLTATSFESPRVYTGSVTYSGGNTTAALT